MFNRAIFAGPLLALSVITADAQEASSADAEALFAALGLPEMLEVMREEGIVYGAEIGSDLFADRTSVEWTEMVSDIYDVDRMRSVVLTGLTDALEGAEVPEMLAFFTSETGETIVSYELAARRALLDDAVDEAAKEVAAQAAEDQTDRYQLITEFVTVNDLVDTNVVGAMNANYAFYIGLMEGGALPGDLTEDQILADVWGQEPEIRANTTEWVYSFLMLAYQPLPDADLQSYIDFSETEAGQDLNQAMFTAFDAMFEDISRALGFGSAKFMAGQDI